MERTISAQSGHTPEPWHHGVHNPMLVWSGRKIESIVVATCEREEDARLIAAAPDMLAALQMVSHDVRSGSLPTQIQNAIIAAITKATDAEWSKGR